MNVLPVWIGWDKLNPTHTAEIMVNGDLDRIEIDPSLGCDINMLNNSNKVPVDIGFDSRVWNWPDPSLYHGNGDRTCGWNDGWIQGKVCTLEQKLFQLLKHIFNLTAWVNSGLGQGSPLPGG